MQARALFGLSEILRRRGDVKGAIDALRKAYDLTEAQAGDREKAFARLEAAFVERSSGLVFLKVDTAWDGIRGDTRFAALVKRVGIS